MCIRDSLYSAAWKSQFLSGIMMPIMSLVGNLGYVGVSILGGILAMQGTITVGEIQSFIQYVRSFTQPINQIAQITNQLQSTAAAAERVFEFLDEEEEETTKENGLECERTVAAVFPAFDRKLNTCYSVEMCIRDSNCSVLLPPMKHFDIK